MTGDVTRKWVDDLFAKVIKQSEDGEVIPDVDIKVLRTKVADAMIAAERKGEHSTMKLMVRHAELHNLVTQYNYGMHVLKSMADYPDQPLASEMLVAMDKKKGIIQT